MNITTLNESELLELQKAIADELHNRKLSHLSYLFCQNEPENGSFMTIQVHVDLKTYKIKYVESEDFIVVGVNDSNKFVEFLLEHCHGQACDFLNNINYFDPGSWSDDFEYGDYDDPKYTKGCATIYVQYKDNMTKEQGVGLTSDAGSNLVLILFDGNCKDNAYIFMICDDDIDELDEDFCELDENFDVKKSLNKFVKYEDLLFSFVETIETKDLDYVLIDNI